MIDSKVFSYSVDDACLLVAREAIKSCRRLGDFDSATSRLLDIRAIVHLSLGQAHPLYSLIDAAIDSIINKKWPEL